MSETRSPQDELDHLFTRLIEVQQEEVELMQQIKTLVQQHPRMESAHHLARPSTHSSGNYATNNSVLGPIGHGGQRIQSNPAMKTKSSVRGKASANTKANINVNPVHEPKLHTNAKLVKDSTQSVSSQ